MDEAAAASTGNSLPPPPQSSSAPGTNTTNGSGSSAHMPPPPLPPVVIPQNNNPIPTAVTSPYPGSAGGVLSPGTGNGGSVRRSAPEPNKRALYVGGLDPRVTEEVLRQIFETAGHVQSVKIIPDKNVGPHPLPSGGSSDTPSMCAAVSPSVGTCTQASAFCEISQFP